MKNIITVVAALLFSTITLAQPIDRTGFYGGIHVGHSTGTVEETPNFGRADVKPKGSIVGAQLGYQKQFDKLVLGLEADMSANNASGSRSAETCQGCVGYSNIETMRTKLGWTGSVRARLGYAAGRLMPYLTGGIAYASVTTTTDNAWVDNAGFSGTYSRAVKHGALGSTLGFGAEYALTRHALVGVEYRRDTFSLEKVNETYSSSVKEFKNDGLYMRLNYKF